MNSSTSSEGTPRQSMAGPKDPRDILKSRIISLAYNSDERKTLETLQQALEADPEFNMLSIRDGRGYTLLHVALLNTLNEVAELVIHHLDTVAKPSERIDYLAYQTDEGFTALHFAAFRGNLRFCRMLTERGADIKAKNKQGLNVIHIAAQGDQPVSIAYFIEKGVPLSDVDAKGSTALHWAAFLGCENSTNFLTSWGADPNQRDLEGGLTPLHLGVISGNTRVVRKLLIKGADKTLLTNEHKSPLDLARENEFDNIIQLLRGRNFLVEFCNIRPGLGSKRTRSSLYAFFILYVIPHILDIIFVLPFLPEIGMVVVFLVLFAIVMLFFTLAWRSNPGYLPKGEKADLIKCLETHDCIEICPECRALKPPRSRHCELCGRCVQVFDHHCPWIDNCVGARNHKYFYTFILILLFDLCYLVIFAFRNLNTNLTPGHTATIFSIPDETAKILKIVFSLATLFGSVGFAIPLSILVYVQTNNLLLDKTTNERFSANRRTASTATVGMVTKSNVKVSTGDYVLLDDPHSKRTCGAYYNNCLNICFRNKNNIKFISAR